jgi:hypothetical protein
VSSSAGTSVVLYHRVCALVLKEVHSAVRDGRRLGFSGNASVSAVLFNVCMRASLCRRNRLCFVLSVPDGQSCQVLIVSVLCASVQSHTFNLL